MQVLLENYLATMLIWAKYMGFFFVLELLFAAHRKQPWQSRVFNLLYLACYTAIAVFVFNAVSQSILQQFPKGNAVFGLAHAQSFIGKFAYLMLYLLAYDFFYYWFHRMQHRTAALWRVHRLHHSELHLNVTTSLRHHWLEEPLKIFTVGIPLQLLLSVPLPDLGLLSIAVGGWAFFIHSNIRLSLGPLSYFFVGPQAHRIHHSIEPQHTDKNFAAIFPIWDILFGTYFHPRKGEFPNTGLHGNVEYKSVTAATLSVWVEPTPIESSATRTSAT
jgi:sterol desaturase/sphingolipid hydroxylase (fatty acid hydroxylase superfamily)